MQKKYKIVCKMVQFSVNLNHTTTVHKLQGMSKDTIFITTWLEEELTNWEYILLFCTQTLEGLYLLYEIDMDKSFAPTEDLKDYFWLMILLGQEDQTIMWSNFAWNPRGATEHDLIHV